MDAFTGREFFMKILLYQDNTLDLDIEALSSALSIASSGSLVVEKGTADFRIPSRSFHHPTSYGQLSRNLLNEAKAVDFSFCFTRIPYDNNYFYHAKDNLVVVSFYAWEQLTTLPIENGAIYFIASVLRFYLPLPSAHKTTTGCLNDFLWDKSGVDLGMRSGVLCSACQEHTDKQKFDRGTRKLLDGIGNVLNDLGAASRNHESIGSYWKRGRILATSDGADKFGVFLCHSSKDKAAVRKINRALKTYNVRTWLDEEQLRPGMAWQVILEEQISRIATAAVFVGSSGIGPWQNMEIRAFLSEFLQRSCPVIPVILPNAKTVPELPIFLRQLTWVDFREGTSGAMTRLIWGITGTRPQISIATKRKSRTRK
jgi:hypothetical protein